MKKNSFKSRFLWSVIVVSVAAIAVIRFSDVLKILKLVLDVLKPFFGGVIIAFIWSLPLKALEKRYLPNSRDKRVIASRRPVCMLLSLLILLAIISGVLYLVIPQIYNSLIILGQAVPTFARQAQRWFLEVTAGMTWANDFRREIGQAKIDWPGLIQYVMDFFGGGMSGALDSTFLMIKGALSNVFGVFISLVFAAYLLLNKEKLRNQIYIVSEAYLPLKFRREFSAWYEVIVGSFASFIVGQVTDAFLLGLMMLVSMTLLHFPYALMIAAVIVVTALVPMVGAILGGAVGFLMIAMIDIKQAIFFLLLFVIIQQIDNNLVYPKVVGDAIGLPGIWVFCAVMIGGSLAGALGMLGAVPLTAGIYKMMRQKVAVRHAAKSEQEREEEDGPLRQEKETEEKTAHKAKEQHKHKTENIFLKSWRKKKPDGEEIEELEKVDRVEFFAEAESSEAGTDEITEEAEASAQLRPTGDEPEADN